ncbi:MAG TPA: DUF695 domain-containing protein [Alcanivorax sp.]|nr:DUF695 domain-containing protein [Alcanivorax sp.]
MPRKLFGRKKEEPLKENEVRVVLPEESYTLMEWKEDGLPCIGMLNSALSDFEHKQVFGWHLSVIIDFEETVENEMPSEEEREIVDPFCDKLDEEIKAGGNALFLIRETWNRTRRLVWRVYDPEIAHHHLQYLVDHHRHPRPFDWRMEQDVEWDQAEWYFKQLRA